MNFDEHIKNLSRKINSELRALSRITPCMSLTKKKILMNLLFNAQFNYYPAIWMSHNRRNQS